MAFFIRLPAILALLLLTVFSVRAQDNVPRTDVLKGTKGERACDIQTQIYHCQDDKKAARREIEFEKRAPTVTPYPIANLCSCNDVFFNIWSACTYSLGYNELPVFNDWLVFCANRSISVMESERLSQQPGALGIEVPGWATVPVPGGKFFDIQEAAIISHTGSQSSSPKPSGKSWSTIQIVLPIVTAIASALLMTLVFLVFKKRYAAPAIPMHNLNLGFNRRPSSRGMTRLSSISNLKAEAALHGGVEDPAAVHQ